MANGIESFDWGKNLAKVTEGWSDGPQFKNPNLSPSMTIVDKCPASVDEKLMTSPVTQGPIEDVWMQRRSK